jgi:hypothetical protein
VTAKAHGERAIRHPTAGRIVLQWHSLVPPEAADQRVKMFEPADDASARALGQLKSARPASA